MSKARGLADLGNVFDDGALSNRNLIINGAMQVAQRGTSATGVNANGFYTCDRFEYSEGSGGGSGVLTNTQSTDAPAGFSNSLKFEVTTTDTLTGGENVGIRHRLEGQNVQHLKFGSSSAESITVSFWIKASLAGTYGLQLFSAGGTRTALAAYTVSSANTWEYKTITSVGDTGASIANDNNRGFELYFAFDAGPDDIASPYTWSGTSAFQAPTGQVNMMATSGATWQITGVQLEVGDTATPFEHRSYGDELARCQRYYYNAGLQNGAVATRYGTSFRGRMYYPTTMRGTPSITIDNEYGNSVQLYAGSSSENQASDDMEANNINENGFRLQFNSVALSADSGYILYLTYVADAEL